ncbi:MULTISPECIES: DUF3343 domain-containing protein [Helicobacter]|uniref:Putative Se/S carrier protein-like domain-containing protein n=1 Tax=Helicobacter ganmani TaxID=60246 RepID=A0A3D8IAE3_9HELI|nr:MULTISPECIES: DUF3343 domain-containing protein [Helicobacter]RDU62129.1 hypothetical protein CQA43_07400 [Helicobacter ganmani]
MIKGYILVFTTSSAFESETILKDLGITIKLVPTPREFSSDCGIAVYFEVENEKFDIISNALKKQKIEFDIKYI